MLDNILLGKYDIAFPVIDLQDLYFDPVPLMEDLLQRLILLQNDLILGNDAIGFISYSIR